MTVPSDDTAATIAAELNREIGKATDPGGEVRLVPVALLERARNELEDLERELRDRADWMSASHVATLVDDAERELADVLAARVDVEVLALMRFAVILDRGAPLLACAGFAPAAERVAKMGETRLELAKRLRAAANAIDPPG